MSNKPWCNPTSQPQNQCLSSPQHFSLPLGRCSTQPFQIPDTNIKTKSTPDDPASRFPPKCTEHPRQMSSNSPFIQIPVFKTLTIPTHISIKVISYGNCDFKNTTVMPLQITCTFLFTSNEDLKNNDVSLSNCRYFCYFGNKIVDNGRSMFVGIF